MNRWTEPPTDTDPDEAATDYDAEHEAYREWARDMYADVDRGFYE